MRRILCLALVAILAVPAAAAEGEGFFLKDGDRVVMLGDSITEQHLYSNYVELWTVTRFPAWNLTFRNVGIGGDTSGGGNSRFRRDVVSYQPTALTVDFGMNDGGYGGFNEGRFQSYLRGLQGIADQAKKANVRVAWITPQPLDTDQQGAALTGYNQTLERFSEGVRTIAEKDGGRFVDQFHPYLKVLDTARAARDSTPYQRITGGDPVHPGPPGQALMAASILKGLRFPSQVAKLEIDLAADRVAGANCQVRDLARDGDGVRFQRQDNALPFFPADARPILKWSPLLEDMNKYILLVSGLKPGKYAVHLGGTKVAEHTAAELAKGVNLADAVLTAGPIADQVKAVRAAVEAKNRYHHDRIFRGVVLAPVNVPDWLGVNMKPAEIEAKRRAAREERLAKMPELDAAVRKALEMKPYTVEIKPVGQ